MHHPLTHLPATDPGGILQLRDRQYAAELITAALLHFDFFTWLDNNAGAGAAGIVSRFGFAERPADVLITLCRAYGYLAADAEGGYHLTPPGREYLSSGSPWFLGPYFQPIRDTPIVHGFVRVLSSGQPASWQAKEDGRDWHQSMQDPEFAQGFTHLMNCRGITFGQALARSLGPQLRDRRHLLDVGGGSGIYASTMVAAHPQLRATVLEQPPVDGIARKEIARHGLEESITVLSGDMFHAAWPETDVLLLSNVLHDWDVPEVRMLLELAARALGSGGLLVIHDAFINDDKTGPLPVAEYSALLMNITQGKCYSAAEYGTLLTETGFAPGKWQSTVANRGYLTARRL